MPIPELLKLIIASVATYFSGVNIPDYTPMQPCRADSVSIDCVLHVITVYANEAVCSQPLTNGRIDGIYSDIRKALPQEAQHYDLRIYSSKTRYELRQLVPFFGKSEMRDSTLHYPKPSHPVHPWLTRSSRPQGSTYTLDGTHLYITPSHGRYYKYGDWHWQRPKFNASREDLLTQDIVNPLLIPMLEHAGAIVTSARERDPQTHECVLDNDTPDHHGSYVEHSGIDDWQTAETTAFGCCPGMLNDSIEPFTLGTARFVHTTTTKSTEQACPSATYIPNIPKSGLYAVYVSYVTLPASVSDAHYVVRHCGVETHFRVNQQMGEKTWLYLGTFRFEKGKDLNRASVSIYADSHESGFVTTDAVRFGGGIGQTTRGEDTDASGVPRILEGARYNTQWCGLPLGISNYDTEDNDYNDDIRSRSRFANYLAGGSPTLPDREGLKVPLALSLALHTDAGKRWGNNNVGSLTICTTTRDDETTAVSMPAANDNTILTRPRRYPSGISRKAARDFADLAIQGLQRDLSALIGKSWSRREIFDRNYGETRTPSIPAIIVEGLSHENFADMRFAHDPHFRFALARSLYKSVARMTHQLFDKAEPIIQPLPVSNLTAMLNNSCDSVTIAWTPTLDPIEDTASPTDYIIYISSDADRDFDNGQLTSGSTAVRIPLIAGHLYSFKVSAVNAGGESMPSHTLYAYRSTASTATKVWLVDGFDRLSGPAYTDGSNPDFDLKTDIGVPYIYTLGLCGDLGGTNGTLTGRIVAGNDGNILSPYAKAMAVADCCHFASGTAEAISSGYCQKAIEDAEAIVYAAGQNADFRHNLKHYEAIPASICQKLGAYVASGGNLMVSGQYIASESVSHQPLQRLMSETLGGCYQTSLPLDSLGEHRLYDSPNADHYFVQKADVITTASSSDTSQQWMQYNNGMTAAVARQKNQTRTVFFAYPLDAIQDKELRDKQITEALQYILGNRK